MENSPVIAVQVCYLAPEQQWLQPLSVPTGTTIEQALQVSGLWQQFPQTRQYKVGVFSRIKPLEAEVLAGDRIEIYRPLQVDPMAARRKRAVSKS